MAETIGPLDAARAALDALETGRDLVIVTRLDDEHAVRRLLVYGDGESRGSLGDASLERKALDLARRALDADEPIREAELLAEAHRAPEQLIVVGAGHIAVPLAELGIKLGFRVTVLDDREAFATDERFAVGVTVRRVNFEADPFEDVRIGARDYVALVTRGHKWDFDCLTRLLSKNPRPRYIGMIGSRRRVRSAFRALLAAGVPRSDLAGIRAPIGIELNAETPEEIAVSIVAELVAVRRGAEAGSIAARERVLDRFLEGAES